ncbi:MAG: AMP-binding protein [Acidimicrobiales bacterium]|nr:AMP-binding protein [Acidimicrobiales bacterium]
MLTWNLGDLFEGVAEAVGDREAIVAGDVRLSFQQLDERVNRLANALVSLGVREHDHVGLAMRNSHEYLEATLAAFKIQAVPVNVNTRYTTDEMRHVLVDASVGVVIHDPELEARLQQATPEIKRLQRGEQYERTVASSSAQRPIRERSGEDLYVLYTGGTTGMPRGVVWRHEDLLFAALGAGNPGGEPVSTPEEVVHHARAGRKRCLPASPLTHGTAHWSALSTLLNGGTVIIDLSTTFNAPRLLDLADSEHVTTLAIVGDAFGRPLASALSDQPERWALDDLLVILSGGAALSPGVREELLMSLPWVVVVDGYGTSETGSQGQMPVWAGQPQSGLPRFHVDENTTVLDDAGRPAPPGSGIIGRLAKKGRLPLGYLNDPVRSAQTFVEMDGQRWAIPGDLARVEADGSITLLGRGSSSINTGGEKVFAEEVELTLKELPEVFDAVVVAVPDERFGQRVAAVVSARPGSEIDLAKLDAHCREALAAFKVPRRVVVVDQIVRRPSGKTDLAWATRTAMES